VRVKLGLLESTPKLLERPLTPWHYQGKVAVMKIATSRVTSQGQISIPLEVRRRLGVNPGTTLQWEAEGDTVVVRRIGKYSFADVRKALFPGGPPEARSLEELKKGIAAYVQARYARR
jgi:AbrB family looped-hinge helix DNA binding protein